MITSRNLCVCLKADFGFEPAKGQNSAAVAVVPEQACGFLLKHRAHRKIDLRLKDRIHALELLRHDADNGGGFSVDEDLSSDGVRIAMESFFCQ